MTKRFGFALVLSLALIESAAPAAMPKVSPSGLASLEAVAPVTSCTGLVRTDLSAAIGAAVTNLGAAQTTGEHPFCRVTATIGKANQIEVRLPLSGWTQRLLQTGCGGLCGMLRIDPDQSEQCAPVTDGSIVLASTDMGHQGRDVDWGANPEQRIDFAWRAVHVTALAAKALVKVFYGRPARYAYFSGCSDGGREALMEAQRFPDDFDGIAAGAPALNFTVQNSFHHAWLAKVNTGANGRPLLTAVDMAPLHALVLKSCDALDGLVDGQVTDPRGCRVDPAAIQCAGAYEPGRCLTAEQVAAVRRIYDGARSASGKRLEVGPLMPGSELEWIGVFVPREPDGKIGSEGMALDTINHLLFQVNPKHTIANFPFTEEEFAKEEEARRLYSADDPNLSAYLAHGGKLLLWHGWADPHISPLNSIDYYERVGRALGASRRDAAVRLFLFPGMGHCGGGDGPNQFPLLENLMAWVERGSAPIVMVAHRAAPHGPLPPPGRNESPMHGPGGVPDKAGPGGAAPPSLPPEIIAEIRRHEADLAKLGPRSRPVYAYPQVAVYAGTGSVDEADHFKAARPAPIDGVADWVGSR